LPNFAPLREYSLRLIDEFIETHSLREPFLDAGCGVGHFAAHLGRRGWHGLAVDSSPETLAVAKKKLEGGPVCARVGELFDVHGEFRLIILSTVIEHVREDARLLQHLRTLYVNDGFPGHLIISMPTNPEVEWRWDDDFYGHFRRYTRSGVENLLSSAGFRLLSFWDYTFPAFWALRRVYTAVRPAKKPVSDIPEENTRVCALQSAWDIGAPSRLMAALPVWPLVYCIQKRFREGERGFEAIALAETI
jgi:SAM-dependent methyltransferase